MNNLEKIYSLILNIINDPNVVKTQININDNITLTFNINNLSNYKIIKKINSLSKLLDLFSINNININFNNINNSDIYKILTNIHNNFYSYYDKKIILVNNDFGNELIKELDIYKDIVMNPDKTPEIYLNYIKSRIPSNYSCIELDKKYFPLTIGVGSGSKYNNKAYMIHIKPNNEDPNKKNIYLVGKSITYDSGGINIKSANMEYMKIDMIGSAILLSVLNLLNKTNDDNKYNIHLVIPIAENMINNTAIKPGDILTTYDGKKVEIHNTDAEGRLCMADALVYINKKLINNKSNSFILDIATLTGSTVKISDNNSSIVLSNKEGKKYYDTLYEIGEQINEYVDYITIREENLLKLSSKVADIKNEGNHTLGETLIAGVFLKYFTSDEIPWLHIDVANISYNKNLDQPRSYGIMLLYDFIKKL